MLRRVVTPLFALTGFSALCLQVVWQRVISIHGGVDLFSSATVVAAFMAGLGLGSLLGGAIADRLGPRRSILAFAAANLGIGAFGWASLWIFYDGYRALAAQIQSLPATFAFHFLLLVVPTTLMGLSLPLLSRGVVRSVGEAPSVVSRLYAVNTLGAAAGAAIGGWFLLGNLGFEGTVRLASSLNLFAAAAVFLLWRTARAAEPSAAPSAPTAPVAGGGASVWPWFAIYAATGAAALALEVVYFRLVDGVMHSNSYSFAHVLTLYLILFGAGAAVAGRRAQRSPAPDVAFLWIQFWIGATTLLGVLALVAPQLLESGTIESFLRSDGYLYGPRMPSSFVGGVLFLFAFVVGPLTVMGVPVFLMGYGYPFIAALVLRREDTLGQRTGTLMACNIAGNVLGSLIAGFVLLDLFGTAGTLALLGTMLMAIGVVAALRGTRLRAARAAAVIVAAIALLAVFPSNERLWGYLHGATPENFALVEGRSCVNAFVREGDLQQLHVNANSQNPYPWDDWHVLIGLLPALVHAAPERGLAIGLGAGGTTYGLLLDPRMKDVETVEICYGLNDLLREIGDRGAGEPRAMFDDPRLDYRVGDGRKHLIIADEPYDVVVVDALRPQSAYSGNLYSVEFYETVAEHLAPNGIILQWVASSRVLTTAAEVFPHVSTVTTPERMLFASSGGAGRYVSAQFMLASKDPIVLDREATAARFRALAQNSSLSAQQRASIEQFLVDDLELQPVRSGEPRSAPTPELQLNRDLFPRDEYFLN
jgi:spermidine synthase